MKLSLTLHNKTYSVESDESFDGSNVYDLAEQFKGLLVCAGFHPSNVDQIFDIDYHGLLMKNEQTTCKVIYPTTQELMNTMSK